MRKPMVVAVLGCVGAWACAPPAPAPHAEAVRVSAPNRYEGYSTPTYDGHAMTSLYVPMRDGTKLAVDIFRPTKGGVVAEEKLPVVWMHTPYNRRNHRRGPTVSHYTGNASQLIPHGYVVAVADFRGVYASYGTNIGYNRGEWLGDAKWDGYDLTEWFAAQPWSSGKVGMWGCSATGGSQMQVLTTRPPSLKAVVPMSAEFDAYTVWTLGGAARADSSAPRGGTTAAGRDAEAVPVDGADGPALLKEAIASHVGQVDAVGAAPFRDSDTPVSGAKWWEQSSPFRYLDALKGGGVGVLSVANWDEAGTKGGPFLTFNNLDPAHVKLLVGPARHCDWDGVREETGFDIVTEELRFFDHWLKGVPNGVMDEPAVTYFTYNAPKDSAWRQSETWPLKNEARTDFHLSGGALASAPGAAAQTAAKTSEGPLATSILIEPAKEGVAYETAPLPAAVEVTGHPVLHLWVSADVADVDVTARLDDMAPDGSARSYQMAGRLRASHRKTAEAPYNNLGLPWRSYTKADAAPLERGKATELAFDMLPMSYIFPAGHRIRLTVTFSDPAGGKGGGAVRILEGGATPSRITLPVIPAQ